MGALVLVGGDLVEGGREGSRDAVVRAGQGGGGAGRGLVDGEGRGDRGTAGGGYLREIRNSVQIKRCNSVSTDPAEVKLVVGTWET